MRINTTQTYRKIIATLFLVVTYIATYSQITLSATGGTTTASYLTLRAAFNAINLGTHTGVIDISITGNITDTASAVLKASGVNSASYSSIKIQPSGGPRTISGTFSKPVIDLNGADFVNIDGINSGGNSLTIQNTSATNGASAIRFINDASGNIIKNCTILSSCTSYYGTIIFADTVNNFISLTGNDQDTITNCIIDAAGSNLPGCGIYCSGSDNPNRENSGIVISNNIIANFFTAVLPYNSFGINISRGATDWTIHNNRMYQSAPRVVGAQITCISIGAGSNYKVTNNTIGFSNANGTGTYTMTSSGARFIGISVYATSNENNVISNNIFSSISLSTNFSSGLNGDLLFLSILEGNVTVSGNVIGASTGTGSITLLTGSSLASIVGIYSTSSKNISILNNYFGGFSCIGSSSTNSGSVYGITILGSANSMIIRGNTIGNSTPNNMLAGSGATVNHATVAIGINDRYPCKTADFSNNTIRNFFSKGSGSGSARAIYTGIIQDYSCTYKIDSNMISNILTNSRAGEDFIGLSAATGIFLMPGTSGSVSYNTISNVSCLNTNLDRDITVAGIIIAGGFETMVKGNKIFDLKNNIGVDFEGNPPIVAGISITAAKGSCNLINNMISLGSGQATNTTFIGIYSNHSCYITNPFDNVFNLNIHFNTVNITGVFSGGILPSYCYLKGHYQGNYQSKIILSLRNNILNNARTGGTSKNYAIGCTTNYTDENETWIPNTSNNNILNSDSLTIAYRLQDLTFEAWKVSTANDLNSYTRIPITFTNDSDLHINASLTSHILESSGVEINGINNDVDLQTRPNFSGSVNGGGLAPDIGCDEFDGIPIDNSPPAIQYLLIHNSTTTSNITLTDFATISDVKSGYYSGVDTIAGNKPRLYFKKSTDNNSFVGNTNADNGWKWVAAGNSVSPFNFTTDYSIIYGGTINYGDIIQYFVVAQDQFSPTNVACNPFQGFNAASISNIISAPTNPNFYVIANSTLNTSINVGAGQAYTSLTGSTGAFQAINNGLLANNTVINITSDLNEDGTNSLLGIGLNGFRLTIQSSTSTVRIISNSTNLNSAMLRMVGTQNVIFDGRIGGSGQYLRIVNTNTSATNAMPALSMSDSASVTLLNSIFESNASSSSQATILLGNGKNYLLMKGCLLSDAMGTPGTSGRPYSALYSNSENNVVTIGGATTQDGNSIKNFIKFGINLNQVADSALIQNNDLYESFYTAVTFFPICIKAGNFHNVSNNNIFQISSTYYGGMAGICILGGVGHKINYNSIGGSSALRTGPSMSFQTNITSEPYAISGIFLAVGNTPATSIQGNYFSNIANLSGIHQPLGIGTGVFAINILTGNVNIGTDSGNIIGGLPNASDFIVNGYNNGMINYSGTGVVRIENNNIGNISYNNGGAMRNSGITILNKCNATIKNNIIHDISAKTCFQSVGALSTITTEGVNGPMGICLIGHLINHSNIEGNTIYNITNTIKGSKAQAYGISNPNGTDSTTTIQRNRIYNVQINGSIYAADYGIFIGGRASGTYSNNQISIGMGIVDSTYIYGIYNNSLGVNNFYNNSILITGNCTSSYGLSYGIFNNNYNTSGIFNIYNNIFYNGRTSPSNKNFVMCQNDWYAYKRCNSNYNLYIGSYKRQFDMNAGGFGFDLPSWCDLFKFDKNSVTDTMLNVLPTDLFVSPATGDLNIQSANVESWWSNGLGIALTNQSADFGTDSAVRSTTIATGSTDLGSDEFTPTIAPPNLSVLGTHTAGKTDSIVFLGRQIAKIKWGSIGTIPTISSCRFYSGTWPNDTTNGSSVSGAHFFDSYLTFGTNGGNGYNYSIQLNYDSAMTGTIASESNLKIAKKEVGVNGTWNLYNGWLDTINNRLGADTIKQISEFTGSELLYPLGPIGISKNLISSNQVICFGSQPSTLTGTTPSGGNGTINYIWQSSTTSATTGFSAAPGASTNANYSSPPIFDTTWFRRIISSGVVDTSNIILVIVHSLIDSNTIHSPQTVCYGTLTSKLLGDTPIGGSGNYSYQWLKSSISATAGFSKINGETALNYLPGILYVNTWFKRIVATVTCIDTSSAILITVIPPITNNYIGNSRSICENYLPGIITGTIPSGGGGNYSYQWIKSITDSLTGYSTIIGATSKDYTPGAVSTNTWYKRIIQTLNCIDTSSLISILKIPKITNNIINSSQTICYGTIPNLLQGSTPSGGGAAGGYSYQWFQSVISDTSGFTSVVGATQLNYIIPIISTTTWFRRVITTASCSDTSLAIKITVNPVITSNFIGNSQNICIGDSTSLIIGSTPSGGGSGYNYQWLISTINSSSGFTSISGVNTKDYAPDLLSVNTWYKRVVNTTTCFDTSNVVQMTLNALPKSNVNGTILVCSGDTSNYSDTLQNGIIYTWNITNGILLNSNSNLAQVIWGAAGVGRVTTYATNPITSCKATSSIDVIINTSPIQPQITRTLKILSVVSYSGVTYQWYLNGNIIIGANSNTINASTNNGKYTVKASYIGCSRTSVEYDYVSVGLKNNALVNDFSIYPNPNRGEFNISYVLNYLSEVVIIVSDVTGRRLSTINKEPNVGLINEKMNLKYLSKGIYFIIIETSEGNLKLRVTIE